MFSIYVSSPETSCWLGQRRCIGVGIQGVKRCSTLHDAMVLILDVLMISTIVEWCQLGSLQRCGVSKQGLRSGLCVMIVFIIRSVDVN